MEWPPRPLTDAERLDWLRLIRSENVGPITFYHLLRQFGTARAALNALPDLARRGGRAGPLHLYSAADAQAELVRAKSLGARVVAIGDPLYPKLLAAVDDAPPLISIKGQTHLGNRETFAIVGARNASAVGIRLTRMLAAELGRADLVIVSGLARGIDGAAHEGALVSGTIAVLAGGIDVVYPPEHQALYEKISDCGLLIAEMPAGTEPKARHFPRRNRIISGISLGVLVVEAAIRSGSLITARFALEQGREVLAVPGSPLDPRARGTNDLIRQGATLVENADDILRTIRSMPRHLAEPAASEPATPPAPEATEIEAARRVIQGKLSVTPVVIDELVRQSGFAPAVVQTVVLELELAGLAERRPGNLVAALPHTDI